MSFTIAIPTYNRNEKLYENLKKILSQVSSQKIIIIDNNSDIPVSITIKGLIEQYDKIDIKVFRNKTNVGICANFLRCFEYCETEWMWLLSDDDPACPDAVKIIERDIQKYSNYIFINYLSSMVEKDSPFSEVFPKNYPYNLRLQKNSAYSYRKETFSSEGLKDLISKIDSIVNFIFVSSGVYHIPKVVPNLRIGYIYAYSLVPHIATVLSSIGETGKVLFSTDKLVVFNPPSAKDTWSRLTFSQVVTLLMEVPLDLSDESFEILFQKLVYWFMTDEQLFHEVNITYKSSLKLKQWMFIQVIARTIYKKRTIRQKVKVCYMIFKLFFPKFNSFYNKNQIFNMENPLNRL